MVDEVFCGRRDLLSVMGAAITGSVAGCLGGDGSEGEEARKAAETLFVRVREGDIEGANEMIANEGPVGELNESDIEEAEYVDVETETVVVEGESAIVRVTLTDESGSANVLEVGVRKIDGEWLVWEQLANP